MYTLMSIANGTVLHIWNLPKHKSKMFLIQSQGDNKLTREMIPQ